MYDRLPVYIRKGYISEFYLVFKMDYKCADVNFSCVNKTLKRINRIKRGTANLKKLNKRRDSFALYYDKVFDNLKEKNIVLEKLLSTLKLLDSAFYRLLPTGYTRQKTYLTTCLDIFMLYWNIESLSWYRPLLENPSEQRLTKAHKHWCISHWDWGVEFHDLRERWNSDEELSYDYSIEKTDQFISLSEDSDSSEDDATQRGIDELD